MRSDMRNDDPPVKLRGLLKIETPTEKGQIND